MKMNISAIVMIGALIGLTYSWLHNNIDNFLVVLIIYMVILMSAYILLDRRYKVIRK